MSQVKLSVAMATYNGERFLEEQLFSIAKQTRLPDEMVVSDDGSNDRTIDILERFATNAPFPVRVFRNLKPLGYGNNFIKAASLCNGDLIAFSDQDDVWLENKLANSLSFFDDDDVLLSVHSGVAVDEYLQPLGFNWPAIPRTGAGYEREPMKYPYPGFAIVVRKDIPGLFANPRPPELQGGKQMPHDNWVCLLARVYGKIAIIEEPLVLYRRHQTTTTIIHNYSTSERIQLSSKVLFSEEYSKIADWIGLLIDCLQKIETKEHRSWLKQSEVAIQRYRRKQHAYAERARLYASQSSIIDRLRLFVTMVIRGRYFSSKMGNLGVKSSFKDAAFLFNLL
jgi:glycosyltransferase involved in cell wall biosynthesis